MLQVKDIMSTDLYTLLGKNSLSVAKTLMEAKRIRHMLIVNDEYELVGLITHRDLLAANDSNLVEVLPEEESNMSEQTFLKDVMKTNILTVEPEVELVEAGELILRHKIGCLPVVEQKKLVGIVTEFDFVKLAIKLMRQTKDR